MPLLCGPLLKIDFCIISMFVVCGGCWSRKFVAFAKAPADRMSRSPAEVRVICETWTAIRGRPDGQGMLISSEGCRRVRRGRGRGRGSRRRQTEPKQWSAEEQVRSGGAVEKNPLGQMDLGQKHTLREWNSVLDGLRRRWVTGGRPGYGLGPLINAQVESQLVSQPASPHMYTGTCVCPMIALWGASLIARCRLPACLPDLHFVPCSEFPAAPHPAYRSESHSRYESHPFIGTGTSTLGAVLVHSEKSEWTNTSEDASRSFAWEWLVLESTKRPL